MAKTVTIQTRIDQDLKDQANEVLTNIGLDLSTAMRLFMKQVVNKRTIPFKLEEDDGFYSESNMYRLKKSIDDAEAGKFAKTFTSLEWESFVENIEGGNYETRC